MPSAVPGSRGTVLARHARAMVALAAALWLGIAGAQPLEVIELRHRLADDILPALQPLLEPGGVLTGMDAMLFVRTSPANLAQIRQAVAALDRRPRQLLLTVGQGTVENVREAEVRGSATIGGGDVQAGVNRPPGPDSGVAVAARAVTQRADLGNLSSVRTLEGSETFIAVGQTAPLTTIRVGPGRSGTTVVQDTEYRDASTGFYATARVNDDVVTLELAPRQQRFGGSPPVRTVESAGVTTRVSGRLGEWIPVGSATQSVDSDDRGLLTWGTRDAHSQYGVWIKVEEVP